MVWGAHGAHDLPVSVAVTSRLCYARVAHVGCAFSAHEALAAFLLVDDCISGHHVHADVTLLRHVRSVGGSFQQIIRLCCL